MNSTHSQKIILWGGLAFVCGVAWTLGAAIPATITLAAMLGIVIVIILIVAYAILIIAERTAQPTVTRFVERETPQTSVEPQKRIAVSTTRYTVVTQPSARLRQPADAIGTTERQQIEVSR